MNKVLSVESIKEFNYPEHILNTIKKGAICLVEELSKICGGFTVILHGSTSRGELTYSDSDCFSDVEFYVITPYLTRKQYADKVKETLTAYSKKFSYSELFHFDVTIKCEFRMPFLQKDILNYELKQEGKVLFGNRDILTKLPKVDIDNIDIKAVNDIILMRLRDLLKVIDDPDIVKTDISKDKQLNVFYSLYREILDIVTVILPHINILESTYKRRHNKLIQVYESSEIRNFFDGEFLDLEKEALKIKLTPNYLDSNYQREDLYILFCKVIGYYSRLIYYLGVKHKILDPSKIKTCADVFKTGKLDIFNDKVFNIYNLAAKLRIKGVQDIHFIDFIKLLTLPVKSVLGVSIYSILLYIVQCREENKSKTLSNYYINRAKESLEEILSREIHLTADFTVDYRKLREGALSIYSCLR